MIDKLDDARFEITEIMTLLTFMLIIIPAKHYIMLIFLYIVCGLVIVPIIYLGCKKKKWAPLLYAVFGIIAGIIGGALYSIVGPW